MVQHKTQSPIGRSSRRRSVSNLTNVLPELQNKSMVTPRTAFEGFIDQGNLNCFVDSHSSALLKNKGSS
jgi:hypothetical protein